MSMYLATLFWIPDPRLGARLVAASSSTQAPVSTTWLEQALHDRALVAEIIGPFASAPRCVLCPSAGTPTFLLTKTYTLDRANGGTAHIGDPQQRHLCPNCGKTTSAIDTSPMTGHQALTVWTATLQRLPAVLGTDTTPIDGWPKTLHHHHHHA